MAQTDSIQKAEVDLVTDAPLADLRTVYTLLLHNIVQVLEHLLIPFRILCGNNRKLQTFDIKVKSS